MGLHPWVSIQHNVTWAEAYNRTKWHLDLYSCLATIDLGRKVGAAVPLLGPGPRPTSIPSGILFHPAVWSQ